MRPSAPGSILIAVSNRSRERQAWPDRTGLAGRAHGDPSASGAPLVLLHGLTFDHRMWGPVLDALPSDQPAIAFDLPGHGESAPLPEPGLAVAVEAIHQAVLDAALEVPILVGHAIGGQLATSYAARHTAGAVVSVDAPVHLEAFVQLLRSLRPELTGDRFGEAWAIYQDSWHMELLPDADRALLRSGDRHGDDKLRELVLGYHSDLLERPLEESARVHDEELSRLQAARTPYLTLHSSPVDRSDAARLRELLPQAEILVWPVGHHFPHLAHPVRFAAVLTELAARGAPTTPGGPR